MSRQEEWYKLLSQMQKPNFPGPENGAGEVFAVQKPKPGQDLVLAGYIGLYGTVLAVNMGRERLARTLSQGYLEEASELLKYRVSASDATEDPNVTAAEEVGEGGIFAALWNLAQRGHLGLQADFQEIAVRQETIEVCEVFDLNPYQLYSGGCFLLAADQGTKVSFSLRQKGIPARVIGVFTEDHDRVIVNGEGRRYLTKPCPDEIYRFMDMEDEKK